ncbi:RICIN domain-containing protein [Knoellia sp. S7-12]|uniref:RICIN domain-containing protein n=1 Tax=Knoellia sp. S7-12 TaxID=3126698 RepID=UPI00338D8D45
MATLTRGEPKELSRWPSLTLQMRSRQITTARGQGIEEIHMSRKFGQNFSSTRRAWLVPGACLLGLALGSVPQTSSASQGVSGDLRGNGSRSAVSMKPTVGETEAHHRLDAKAPATPVAPDGGLALVRAGAADDVYYVRAPHSGKCMTVRGASQAAGATVDQYTCLGQANQRWILSYDDDIWMTFRNVNSAQCLSVNGGSSANGARLIQWPCSGQLYAKFSFNNPGQMRTRTSSVRKCVVVNGYSKANSAYLIQYPCSSSSPQTWSLFG